MTNTPCSDKYSIHSFFDSLHLGCVLSISRGRPFHIYREYITVFVIYRTIEHPTKSDNFHRIRSSSISFSAFAFRLVISKHFRTHSVLYLDVRRVERSAAHENKNGALTKYHASRFLWIADSTAQTHWTAAKRH